MLRNHTLTQCPKPYSRNNQTLHAILLPYLQLVIEERFPHQCCKCTLLALVARRADMSEVSEIKRALCKLIEATYLHARSTYMPAFLPQHIPCRFHHKCRVETQHFTFSIGVKVHFLDCLATAITEADFTSSI